MLVRCAPNKRSCGHVLLDLYRRDVVLFSGWGGLLLSPKRRAGHERRYARYAHVSALLWSAVPLITGDGPWCVFTFPLGLAFGRLGYRMTQARAGHIERGLILNSEAAHVCHGRMRLTRIRNCGRCVPGEARRAGRITPSAPRPCSGTPLVLISAVQFRTRPEVVPLLEIRN
jgi:hypothetical protein